MNNTVLQQGDKIGTTGATGDTGATGGTGAVGQPQNILSVELVYTFSPIPTSSSVALAKTYVVEKGATNFWKASGVHSYVNSAFLTIPAKTTISGFLNTTTKKYSVHLQLKRIDVRDGVTTKLLPLLSFIPVAAEIFDTTDDNIVIRFTNRNGQPISFYQIANLFGIRKLTFSLLIIGTDQ